MRIGAVEEALLRAVAQEILEGREPTVVAVARRAGLSARQVFRYFSLRELREAFAGWAAKRLDPGPPPEDLELAFELLPRLFDALDREESLARAQLLSTPGGEGGVPAYRARLARLRELFAPALEGLSPRARPRAAAVLLLLASASAWSAMREEAGPSGEELGRACRWALRVLLRELKTNPGSFTGGD